MTDFIVTPQRAPLRGVVPVPSDKSITHRAFLFAALADGVSLVRTDARGEDNTRTLEALRRLGAGVTEEKGALRFEGRGLYGLTAPDGPIDCGNSGTTLRLLAGLLASQRFRTTLIGDASLSARPMARVANPLRQRGARIEGAPSPAKVGEITAPLEVGPLPSPHLLSELSWELPIASAQVKSALLLSGLFADGPTLVSEPTISRDHTERMLDALELPVRRQGSLVHLDPRNWDGKIPAFEGSIPGDISAAAFLLAAGLLVEGSDVAVRNVGLNPTRTGFVDAIRHMGATLEVSPEGERLGEPIGQIRVAASALVARPIGGELVVRSIDEIPILAALGARSRGVMQITDAAELRVKETDRIAAIVDVLRCFGISADEQPTGLTLEGRDGPLRACEVDSRGDHRIAMSAAVLGLLADGPVRVRNVDAVATSFPRFAGTLRALGAEIRAT